MNKLIIAAIIIFAAFTRFIPHPPNFTPIIAIGLFGGAYLEDRRLALIIPLIAMIIADAFLGFHEVDLWDFSLLVGCANFTHDPFQILFGVISKQLGRRFVQRDSTGHNR